jgi:phosphoribosylformylglycinamidine synthase
MATIALKRDGDAIILIGETKGQLGQSIYLREVEGREEGGAPAVDLRSEKRNGDFVRALIVSGRVDTVHDLSDGGLLVAVAEMAMAGNIGAAIDGSRDMEPVAWLFGEDQARYVLAVSAPESAAVLVEARAKDVTATLIGMTGGTTLKVDGAGEIPLARLKRAHEGWFPAYMKGEEIPPTN